MSKSNVIIAFTIIWAAFLIWEIMVSRWVKSVGVQIFRLDLVLILPGLVGVTVYFLMKMRREKQNSSEDKL